MIKLCKKCNEEKPITEFIKNKHSKGGYENRCLQCAREYARLKNPPTGKPRGPKKGFKHHKKRKYSEPILHFKEYEIIDWVNKIKETNTYYVPYLSKERNNNTFQNERSFMQSIGWKLTKDSKALLLYYYRKIYLNNNNCKGCNVELGKDYVISKPIRGKKLIEWCETCYNNKKYLENCIKASHTPEARKRAVKTKREWYNSKEGKEWRKRISEINTLNTKEWKSKLTEEEKKIINKKSSDSQIANILNGSFDPQKNYKHYKKNKCIINGEEKIYRSSWEVVFAISNPHLKYESLKIPYKKDNGNKGIYIPDFIDEEKKIIYELKPRRNFHKQQTKMDASIKWCIENNYKFIWINEDNLLNYISEDDNCFEQNKKFYNKVYKGLDGNIKNKINKENQKEIKSI